MSPALDNQIYPLIFYGNNVVTNAKYMVGDWDRSSAPFDIQTQDIARGIGSTPINSRLKSREIDFMVQCLTLGNPNNQVANNDFGGYYLQAQAFQDQLKKIFSYNDRYLRIMPKGSYLVINRGNSITSSSWQAFGDANTLTLDTTDMGLDDGSISCSMTATTSGLRESVMLTDNAIGVDLSALKITYNLNSTNPLSLFEYLLFVPDEVEFDSVGIRVGSSNTDYYAFDGLKTNFEGKPIEQGWNLCSVPIPSCNVVGSIDLTKLGKYLNITYRYNPSRASYSSVDVGPKFGGMLVTIDKEIRNYRCYTKGAVNFQAGNYKQKNLQGSVKLLNYTGYGETTFTESMFNISAVTGLSNTQVVNLEGSFQKLLPSIQFKINNATNLSKLRVINLYDTQNYIELNNTWNNGDIITIDSLNKKVQTNNINQEFAAGKLLTFKKGKSQIKFEIIQGSSSSLQNTQLDSNQGLYTDSTGHCYGAIARAFVAPITGTLSNLAVYLTTPPVDYMGLFEYVMQIRSDTSNSPSNPPSTTVLHETITLGNSQYGFRWVPFSPNLSVTSGTKYWIVIKRSSNSFRYYSSGNKIPLSWGISFSGASAAGDNARSSATEGDGSWSNDSGQHHLFTATFQPTPATNIDWSMSYKRLFY